MPAEDMVMKHEIRKLVTIVTEALIEEHVLKDILRLGAFGYTVTEARGKGNRGTREANWELTSSNVRIEVVCEEKVAEAIAAHLQEHYYRNYGMILFMSDVEVLRSKKF